MSKRVTYEDFEEFVRNRPQPDTPGFYKLWRLKCKATDYDRHEVKGESLNYKIPYKGFMWRFPIKDWPHMEFVYYPTFEEAYRAMMDNEVVDDSIVWANSQQGYTFGYEIRRLGFGPHGTRDFYIQYWQYDSEKREFDRSSCSSYHFNMPGSYGKYLGRFPENIRFKEGDIVEIGVSRYEDAGKSYSTLGIVIGTPRTVRQQWEWNEEAGINELAEKGEPNPIEKYYEEPDTWGADIEEYFILYGPYEESMMFATFMHPSDVRPPTFDVPEEAKETLMKYYNEYLKSLEND